ncbi:GTP pyrophosphokinase [Azospirillum sp. sgz302134]
MTEQEFLTLWEREREVYATWGWHVARRIESGLQARIAPRPTAEFVRIPAHPRVKATRSLLDKAFLRADKTYTDPYAQITDKVGVRFVVLVTEDIKPIAETIQECGDWTYSKDKDFEEEREKNPDLFAYQSVHFVVRAAHDISCDGTIVRQGTPCEVQLRTLLQHAHSELTHDTIYKPKATKASPAARRYVARSMALVETVDDFFCEVVREFERAEAPLRIADQTLNQKYATAVGRAPEASRANTLLLDAMASELPADLSAALDSFLDKNPFVKEKIAARANDRALYRQPAILLVYLLAQESPHTTQEIWPLTMDELEPIYTDLGRSLS